MVNNELPHFNNSRNEGWRYAQGFGCVCHSIKLLVECLMTVQCTLSFIHYTALYYRPIECFIQPTGLCGGVFFKPAIISEYNVYMAPSNCPQIVHCFFFSIGGSSNEGAFDEYFIAIY